MTENMQVFIYGFKPYLHFTENVTESLIAGFPDQPGLAKHVFDVEFNNKMFISTLDKYKPDLIIGLGQHPGARKLRIERKARNLYQADTRKSDKIRNGGADYLFTNFLLPKAEGTTTTYDAGTYVCNFSMYIMCEYAYKNDVKFAFLHVPISIDKGFLNNYLMTVINH